MIMPNLVAARQKQETRVHYSYKVAKWTMVGDKVVGFESLRDDNQPKKWSLEDYTMNGEVRKGYYTLLEEGQIFDVVQEGHNLEFKLKYDAEAAKALRPVSKSIEELEA